MLQSLKLLGLVTTLVLSLVAPVAADSGPEKSEYADKLVEARIAAIEGGHEKCAKLSDEARRTRHAHWRAHQVYASCTVFAADAQKEAGKITPKAYAKRLRDAVGALQFLMQIPGLLDGQNQRDSVGFMIEQLSKRADVALSTDAKAAAQD